ncbi:MAG: hypothetical protein H6718_33135 [Polyangiaceae bacterium]|nr:hypothetical protein [Polyangiaceae bacterium]MCB9605043.1 hypothetical protein [Polyangiaceae bacterium]
MFRTTHASTSDTVLRAFTVTFALLLSSGLVGCKKRDPCRGTPRAENWTGHADLLPPDAILCANGIRKDVDEGSRRYDAANVYVPGTKAEAYLKITKHLEGEGWRETFRNDLYSGYDSSTGEKLSVQIFKDTDYSRAQFEYSLPKSKP